jgi:hypothetical protein
MGRPREFTRRRVLTVLLEESELTALHRAAAAAGMSSSRLVRKLIQAHVTPSMRGRRERES